MSEITARTHRNALVWWQSLMAFLTFTASATVLGDVVGEKTAAVYLMVVGGLQAATAAFVAAQRPLPESVITQTRVTETKPLP